MVLTTFPAKLTLHVVSAPDVQPPSPAACGGRSIEDWFYESSFGAISLQIQNHVYQLPQGQNSGSADIILLQSMLRQFVPMPLGVGPVSDIALIFCKSWVSKNLFGLMFDYDAIDSKAGFLTSKAPGDPIGVPREGCAVFLDPLSSEPPNHQVHTAIHELGHVFNLHHDLANASFMGTTCWTDGFNQKDKERLKNAGLGLTPNDLPGGSNFEDDATLLARRTKSGQHPRSPRLRLNVSLEKREYILGETIVLDVELVPVEKTTVSLPNHLDPGFRALRIWIETPEGERFLHRPFLRFCPAHGLETKFSQSSPLRNNPRITMGSKGLNFRVSGEYQVWAEFRLPNSSGSPPLLSRKETIRVRRATSAAEAQLAQLLMAPDIAFFLTHGGGPIRDERRKQLQHVIRNHRGHPATSHIRYTLAKHMMRSGQKRAATRLLEGLKFAQPSLRHGLERLQARITPS